MKFFLDSNMPNSAREVFKKFNFGAAHASDVGLSAAPDKQILDFAVKNDCILVTRDLDFANTMLYPFSAHKGIMVLRLPNYFTAVQINNALLTFLNEVDPKEIANAITILEAGKYRIRKA